MEPRQVRTAADARELVESRGAQHVKVGVFDIDGIMRGKYISRDKFLSSLDGGFGFCDVVLGWDCQDQLYDNVKYTGWHTGYPDAPVRILPDTCRELPFEAHREPERKTIGEGALADIARIRSLWREARTRFGNGGQWLFGRFSSMYQE